MSYELHPSTTALLVIDAQVEYFDAEGPASFPEALEVLPAINALIAAFDEAEAPVIYVRHAHRPDGTDLGRMGDFDEEGEGTAFVEGTGGVELHAELRVPARPTVVTKSRYDAFRGTELDGILRTLGVSTVVLCGYMTSFCIDSTARSSQSHDYATLVALDAVGGPDLERLDGSRYPSAQVRADVGAALAGGFAEVATAAELACRLAEG
jgi:ureidoacrylate peracid hydrolase